MYNFYLRIPINNEKYFSSVTIQNGFHKIFDNIHYTIYVLGDCIGEINHDINFSGNEEAAQWIVDNLMGHFYYYISNRFNENVIIGNSKYSILPLFFSISNNILFLSNRTESIAEKIEKLTINKKFILENVLFNYPMFNDTAFNEIKLLSSNSFIEFSPGTFNIKKLKPIEDYYVSNPKPWKRSVNYISDLFIEESKKYFPDEKYGSTLTGGFDGRTLVALGKYYNKDFVSYSFGSKESLDIKIAAYLSSLIKTEFIQFELNNKYIEDISLEMGLNFIKGSEGTSSFSRAHYMYAIKELSKDFKYIVTGNFGSEIFRAPHITGVVFSQNLNNLFEAVSFDDGINKVEKSMEFDWLNKVEFKNEFENLKEDLKSLPCFNPHFKELTRNQQFYKIVFEEIFRKYFGAEMINHYRFFINRTPFLDFNFITEILKTELAGVYSDYFTNNPLKRFKGQMVYANIIKKTFPYFGYELTDKGYKPNDLLSFYGKLKILKSFLRKKILKTNISISDQFSVRKAFESNKTYWKTLDVKTTFFNENKINQAINNNTKNNSLYIVLSQKWYFNYLIKNIFI